MEAITRGRRRSVAAGAEDIDELVRARRASAASLVHSTLKGNLGDAQEATEIIEAVTAATGVRGFASPAEEETRREAAFVRRQEARRKSIVLMTRFQNPLRSVGSEERVGPLASVAAVMQSDDQSLRRRERAVHSPNPPPGDSHLIPFVGMGDASPESGEPDAEAEHLSALLALATQVAGKSRAPRHPDAMVSMPPPVAKLILFKLGGSYWCDEFSATLVFSGSCCCAEC
jgi:hypothetical protein